tara:strand:- start:99 stop:533 length:435 start_codon:yes stop_codon:yes gene_type:complete
LALPERKSAMGDFVRNRFEAVHEILLEDAQGEKIGLIRVNASIHLRESWDHLSKGGAFPSEPAGPHNRAIVAETTGHSVYGHGWGLNVDDPLPGPLPQILADLKERGGLEGIPYTDERFPAAFKESVEAAHGVQVTFRPLGGLR